jgi:chemotaxis protein CheZ
VAAVTEILVASLHRYTRSIDTVLYRECQSLVDHISRARTEIAEIRPNDITERRIPRAGQELAAIIQATEEATGTIMGAAEEMMSADAADAAILKGVVDAACMRIFEACAFQDITGQRIAKVVNTLTFIEDRLNALRSGSFAPMSDAEEGAVEAPDEKSLLNGPALAGEGIDQGAVDALMGPTAKSAATPAMPTPTPEAVKPDPPKLAVASPAPTPAPAPANDLQKQIDALFA